MKLDDRIRQALSRGPLTTYDLAYAVFPVKEYPDAWRYANQGGPHAWVLILGKAFKRLKCKTWMREGRRIVSL